jgi:hypothetical protein
VDEDGHITAIIDWSRNGELQTPGPSSQRFVSGHTPQPKPTLSPRLSRSSTSSPSTPGELALAKAYTDLGGPDLGVRGGKKYQRLLNIIATPPDLQLLNALRYRIHRRFMRGADA